ncbi:MAG: hypothetical protein HDT43_05750 [Ruminococcaceae bacterium]|nr:hypothetical protein [Oscillospiraceae bacterium]
MKYKCPCCDFFTFDEPIENSVGDICPVCYWEIDPFVHDEDKPSGANHGLSLNDCRDNFLRFGACTEKMAKYTRKPLGVELCADGKPRSYFERNIKGGCYHEFARGKWDGETHWSADFLFLDDDLFGALGLYRDIFGKALYNYNYYGPNRVTRGDWDKIYALAKECGGAVAEMFGELAEWAEESFSEYGEFWILGI